MIKKKPSLGIGLYTIPGVANILNLDGNLVQRWLREYWGNRFSVGQDILSSWDKNTNILAETLYSMYTSGGKISFISSLYDVPENDVKASIEFFKKAA